MKLVTIIIFILCTLLFAGCSGQESDEAKITQEPSANAKIELAKCLTQKGWAMYGSYTCSACIAQKKTFGEEAFAHIKEVECNPHAPNTNVELCIEKKIRETPTWILENDSLEVMRIAEYQLLEDLAMHSGCEYHNQ